MDCSPNKLQENLTIEKKLSTSLSLITRIFQAFSVDDDIASDLKVNYLYCLNTKKKNDEQDFISINHKPIFQTI